MIGILSKARILHDFAKTLTPSSEFFDMKRHEKTKIIIGKEMFRELQKSTEICRYFFPSLRYFNFSKYVFKPKFQKTVNLNVRFQRILLT